MSSALQDASVDSDVSATINVQNDVLAAVMSLDAAFAVVCCQTDTVLLVSKGLQLLMPILKNGVSWRKAIKADAELLAAYEGALTNSKGESITDTAFLNAKYQVSFKKNGENQLLVSIRPENTVAENLHEYMQTRDNLFSTSRTISVSEMATTLAHEINTPIGTISNILCGVKIRLKKPGTSLDVIDTALDRALEQTQFSQNIISRIREFTQSRRPKLVVLDIRKQLQEAVALLDWLLTHNACKVELLLSDEALYISGDATMLQQVLINLIRNAVDAMHNQSVDQRHITISAELLNDKVTVSIADTGHGLSENADQLFVPFASTKSGGMGVGLNICRSFIELHQGRLWLSPNDVDGCTCFVELPIASPEEQQRSSSI